MERKGTILVGAPRHGKTYFAERAGISYAKKGGVAVAYNVGMQKDFYNYISVSLITPEKKVLMMKEKGQRAKLSDMPAVIDFFMVNETEKIYHLKDLCRMFRGKCVKIERLNPQLQEERMFFKAVFRYFYNALVILDDFRAMTRNGMPSEFIELTSRQNHCGKNYCTGESVGVDLIYIYHSFQYVPNEMYTTSNSIVQFKTQIAPKSTDNEELENLLTENYEYLKTAPKYTRIEIDTLSLQQKIVKPNT